MKMYNLEDGATALTPDFSSSSTMRLFVVMSKQLTTWCTEKQGKAKIKILNEQYTVTTYVSRKEYELKSM